MKKIVLQSGIFLALVFIANNILFSFLNIPSLWYISCYKQKYYQEHSEINTLFLGSSVTARHVIPDVFDSITSQHSLNTSSFNLGIDASDPAEEFAIYKEVLSDKHLHLNTIILCLEEPSPAFKFRKTLRAKSFFTWGQFYNSCGLNLFSQEPVLTKLQRISTDFVCFVQYQFKTGLLVEALKFNDQLPYMDDITTKGFDPLFSSDSLFITMGQVEPLKNPYLKFLHENLGLLDTNRIGTANLTVNPEFLQPNKVNPAYKHMIDCMMDMAAKRNVHVVFLLPPRMTLENYKHLVPLFASLPKNNKINLADSHLYPEFYSVANSFDLLHLNEPGARIYTTILAEKFEALSK